MVASCGIQCRNRPFRSVECKYASGSFYLLEHLIMSVDLCSELGMENQLNQAAHHAFATRYTCAGDANAA
jgi:hypothetical protein